MRAIQTLQEIANASIRSKNMSSKFNNYYYEFDELYLLISSKANPGKRDHPFPIKVSINQPNRDEDNSHLVSNYLSIFKFL